MRLVRIKAIARKEFIQIWRDPFSLGMALLLPAMLLFIFAYAVTFDVDRITTVVCDRDKSSASRDLVAQFSESRYFSIVSYADSYDQVDRFLDEGSARVAIMIPYDFSRKVLSGRNVSVGIILDGEDSNTATIAQGYVNAIALQYAQRMKGVSFTPLIEARSRVWYNTELKSRNFIIPGLIAVIMAVIISLLTSLTVAKEWDRGTMEQLIATPIKPPELIIGKLIPYFAIGFIDTVVSIVLSVYLFDVPLRGSVTLLLVLSCIFLVGGLSLGIFISIVARDQLTAAQMAMLSSFLPVFMLSGFIFAISNMPKALQIITYIMPARYFVTILKGIFLKGSPLSHLVMETLFLLIFAVLVFIAASRKFKKRIE